MLAEAERESLSREEKVILRLKVLILTILLIDIGRVALAVVGVKDAAQAAGEVFNKVHPGRMAVFLVSRREALCYG